MQKCKSSYVVVIKNADNPIELGDPREMVGNFFSNIKDKTNHYNITMFCQPRTKFPVQLHDQEEELENILDNFHDEIHDQEDAADLEIERLQAENDALIEDYNALADETDALYDENDALIEDYNALADENDAQWEEPTPDERCNDECGPPLTEEELLIREYECNNECGDDNDCYNDCTKDDRDDCLDSCLTIEHANLDCRDRCGPPPLDSGQCNDACEDEDDNECYNDCMNDDDNCYNGCMNETYMQQHCDRECEWDDGDECYISCIDEAKLYDYCAKESKSDGDFQECMLAPVRDFCAQNTDKVDVCMGMMEAAQPKMDAMADQMGLTPGKVKSLFKQCAPCAFEKGQGAWCNDRTDIGPSCAELLDMVFAGPSPDESFECEKSCMGDFYDAFEKGLTDESDEDAQDRCATVCMNSVVS